MATTGNLSINLMQKLLDIINEGQKDLKKTDPTKLRLIEMGPRSEEFSNLDLSCFVSPNDPEDPDGWADEEITAPGRAYNAFPSDTMIEMGGGQYFNIRFTVMFTLFFNELGLSRTKAYESSRLLLDRMHRDFLKNGLEQGGAFAQLHRADDNGWHLFHAGRCVKKRRLTPSGSEDETFYRGKMWLQFEAYMEAEV